MAKKLKIKVVRNIDITRDCTVGKVYVAEYYPKGAEDPDGYECIEDCAAFKDDVGDLVVTHLKGAFNYYVEVVGFLN